MKKFLALLLALVMVFALAACGTDDPGTATTDPQGSTAPDDNVSTEGASVYYLNFKPEQDDAVAGARRDLHRGDRRPRQGRHRRLRHL